MGTAGRALSAFMVVVLVACGSSFEELRAEPSVTQGMPAPARMVFVRALPNRQPVQVSEEDFRAFMRKTAPHLRVHKPLGALPSRSRFVLVSAQVLDPLTRQYFAWCEARGRVRDCSGAVRNGVLDEDGRYTVAFDIALGSQWDGFSEEMRAVLDPVMLRIYLLSAMVLYMGLLAFPGLVTQAFAALVAVVLTAYLGARVLWELIEGWVEMTRQADSATTFEQLRDAGERYGRTIGANTARILVMAVAAVMSGGGVAARMAEMPKWAEASAALARDSGGALSLGEAVVAVSGVRVTASGVTVVLQPVAAAVAPLAVGAAMTAELPGGGQSGKGKAPAGRKEPGEWRKVKNPVQGNPGKYQQQISGHPPDEAYFVGETEFDGYLADEKVLLEAKGEGYAKFFDETLNTEQWYGGARKMLDQARRQAEAARPSGAKVRWHFAERRTAEAMKKMFEGDDRAEGIEVVYTPPAY
ncbi:MAG TPA: Tox-REase-5 domain-containing protein [Myxococcaceae bacterium]|nr:Tox-REase-5 domain-containing protein [Myxococcaceae bacterium]